MHEKILDITDEAIEAITGIRGREPDADDLALSLAIIGARGNQFTYEITFIPTADATEGDAIWEYGTLPAVVAADSIDRLRGATLQVVDGGLAIDNPNSPTPAIPTLSGELSGPVAERIQQVLANQINPAIAGHGGFAELVAVEDTTAYLRLGGGCQGCGLAKVTLGQGIEVAIKDAVPEITEIIDVTDHASGDNPYYESAKK